MIAAKVCMSVDCACNNNTILYYKYLVIIVTTSDSQHYYNTATHFLVRPLFKVICQIEVLYCTL